MAKPTWTFQLTPPMGGATGEAFVNTLFGTGMKPAAVLAREAIQNSSDAAVQPGEGKVRVVFRRKTLTGNEKATFVKTLQLEDYLGKRRDKLEVQKGSCLESLHSPAKPLHLLYVEDYGTYGLYGEPHDDSSHFFRLLLSLGDGSKAREDGGSGGSYGYGKSVYSANSRIHTIFAYSVFDALMDKKHKHARLMGCSYFNRHRISNESFSGRAWFGTVRKEGEIVDPLDDAQAHDLAKQLGFTLRGQQNKGTSILLLDSTVDCEELRSSIEEWWWPRLVDDALDVELYEQGRRVEPPRPRLRPDLQPFIECYDLATKRALPKPKSQKAEDFNKLKGSPLGSYGFSVLSEDDVAADARLADKRNRIALLRSPRMVVEYLDVGHIPLPCVGAFLADPAIDNQLKISEPAAHNKWDQESARLSNLDAFAREVVGVVIARLKGGLRRFANEALPPAPKTDVRVKLLERLLGNLFRAPSKRKGGVAGGDGDPVTIHFAEQPHIVADEGKLRTTGSVRVALDDEFVGEGAEVELEIDCLVVEDDGVSEEESISVEASSEDVHFDVVGNKPLMLKFYLDKEVPATFRFRSSPYDPNWTTELKTVVRRRGTE